MSGSPTAFRERLDREVLQHPVIRANPYTAWFKLGEFSPVQARAFLVQFSVFSNQFLVAALLRVINAPSIQQARTAIND